MMPKVLSLQPYFGGSHQNFQIGWEKHSQLEWTVMTLPPRHWKWRMRQAAWHFAEQVNEAVRLGEAWDVVLCTDMLNLAEFKGLVAQSVSSLPTVIYFHENQFAYPTQVNDQRDLNYAVTNFTSALAADVVWFNSQFNLDSMFSCLKSLCEKWPDFPPREMVTRLQSSCQVNYPGFEGPLIARSHERSAESSESLHIVWAARWEHDKGPEQLLEILRLLKGKEKLFRLSVIGESFRSVPETFGTIRSEFAEQLIHWGYQESRDSYWQVLHEADVILSTAQHEFFGLAVAEAISCGVHPILPNRLAYPELIGLAALSHERHLYSTSEMAVKLILDVANQLSQIRALRINGQANLEPLQSLYWSNRASEFDDLLIHLCQEP